MKGPQEADAEAVDHMSLFLLCPEQNLASCEDSDIQPQSYWPHPTPPEG